MFRGVLIVLVVWFLVGSAHAQVPPQSLVEQLIEDDASVKEAVRRSESDISDVIAEFKAREVDLNGDGKAEYIVSGFFCGQNCSHWIYRRDKRGFVHIPFKYAFLGGTFLNLRPLRSTSNGYRDLRGNVFLNCCEGALFTFKFDGSQYVATTCLLEIYGYTDRRGKYRTYRTPRIKKMQCS